MNENEVVANVTETEEVANDVATEVVPATKDEKMTFSQKFAGLGVIGLAIAGLIWAILGIVKGVKFVISKIKGKKKEQPKVEDVINPDDYVDDGELTEDEANEIGNK